jgi:hypothetical protein
MTTQTEALKLALEALEGFYEYGYDRRECFEHITAIKEALAQPEQEPVAWVVYSSAENYIVWADKGKRLKQNTPLYTTPPQRKPLTHEQRFDLLTKFEPHKNKWEAPAILIDMVEAAHGIKEKT